MTKIKIAILLSYISIASVSAAIITPALPAIQHEFQLGHGALEWVVTIFLLGYTLGQLLYGPLANRYGRLKALRGGLIVNLLGILLCLIAAYVHQYDLLLLGRFVTAIGAAAGLSCTFMLINELLPEAEAKHALSFSVLSFTFGIGLAVLIGGLVTQYLNWTACFWILILHGFLTLLLTRLFKETLVTPKVIHVKAIFAGYKQAFSHKTLVVFALFLGFVSVISYCYTAAAPVISHSLLKLNAAEYGCWNVLSLLGMLLGSFAAAWLLKRLSVKKVLFVGVLGIIVGLISWLMMAILHNTLVFWFFITAAWLYFAASFVFPSASFLSVNAISDRASASSTMSFINMGSAVIAVAVMGYLPLENFFALNITLLGFLLICLVFWLFSRGRS